MSITKEQSLIAKKRWWHKEEKENFVQLWKTSKLSQSEFCRQNNLSLATFSNWVKCFKKTSKEKFSFSTIQSPRLLHASQAIKINLPNGLELNFYQIEDKQIICELVASLLKCRP